DFGLAVARFDHMLHAAANGRDHVTESFKTRAVGDFASRGHDAKLSVRPSPERFQEAIELAALGEVNHRIAVARKYFAKIEHARHMKMRESIGITIARCLVHNVDGFAVQIECQNVRERNSWLVDAQLNEVLR